MNPSTDIDAPLDAPRALPSPRPAERLVSLDAFRGAIMLLMASSAFGLPAVAKHFPDSLFWTSLARQFEHADWVGCTLWDLIQPAFMFTVGVALPYSLANRRARGQSPPSAFGHAIWRSVLLVALAILLTSNWSARTEWVFTNVLAQIGLAFPFLFLLAFTRPRTQAIAAATILFLYWLAFALHPTAPAEFDWGKLGVPAGWPHLTGFEAHWEKNFNFAAAFDRWFLNLFPREQEFLFSTGGYQTLNFIPSLATMIFGLLAGEFLRSAAKACDKAKWLAAAGFSAVILGWTIAALGLCPIVKRIWTPTWAIYSAGCVTLLLAGFVAAIDKRGWKRWAFPLVVAGLDPIALYCLWQLSAGWILNTLKIHLGQAAFQSFGPVCAPILERSAILLVFWLVLWWMYRRKIFLRI